MFENADLNNTAILLMSFMIIPIIAVVLAVCFSPLNRKKLMLFGGAFITISLCCAGLFPVLLDLLDSYEKKLNVCQTKYLYDLAIGVTAEVCKELTNAEKADLLGFRKLTLTLYFFVAVIISSAGVNLFSSGISMTNKDIVAREISDNIAGIREVLEEQKARFDLLIRAAFFILAVSILIFIYAIFVAS